jgi:hypothetical protein
MDVIEAIRGASPSMLNQGRLYDLKPGMRVSFKGRGGRTVFGVVEKLNRTTINVTTDDGQRWRVKPVYLTGVSGN